MNISKKEGQFLNKVIKHWTEENVISEEQSKQLHSSYEVIQFDWKRAAKYSFWAAIICTAIAVSSALVDQWLIELFKRLFNLPDTVKCIIFSIIAGIFYTSGVKKRQYSPEKIYSNEALFFLGVLSTAAAIAFLGKMIDTGSGHFSLLLLLAAILYGILGLWFDSKLVWLFSLASLGSWFGAETGYASGWGAYYLGMNYPLRFVLFGLVLIFSGSYLFNRWQKRHHFLKPTRVIGLLYLFISLWIMSIFGNYGDMHIWETTQQIALFHWSLLFAVAAILCIFHGLKYDDAVSRGFGLTFLFINLYTRFFEYFWDHTHKALFFGILAMSFWYLGSKAESIWQLSLVKKLSKKQWNKDN